MAGLTSHYEMATPLSAEEVHELLREKLGFVTREVKSEKFRPTLYTTNDGLMIETYKRERAELIAKAFQFLPTVQVDMELARGQHPGFEEGARDRIRVVDWLLNNVEGDAVLLVNPDMPVLLRRDGVVRLRDDRRFWSEEHLSLLTVPYTWETLPEY